MGRPLLALDPFTIHLFGCTTAEEVDKIGGAKVVGSVLFAVNVGANSRVDKRRVEESCESRGAED